MIFSLFSPLALTFTMNQVAQLEVSGGLNWSNLFEGDYSVFYGWLFLVGDTIIYLILAWYFDQVVGSEGTSARPWNFFLKRNSRNKTKKKTNGNVSDANLDTNLNMNLNLNTNTKENVINGNMDRNENENNENANANLVPKTKIEIESTTDQDIIEMQNVHSTTRSPIRVQQPNKKKKKKNRKGTEKNTKLEDVALSNYEDETLIKEPIAIKVTNVTKKFREKSFLGFFRRKKKDFTVIDNVSLNVYQGEVLAILGHNGAGKTTLLQMISGMLPISSGEVFIFGKSVRSQMNEIQPNIGMCPQQDVTFDELTPYEHLRLFAAIKNIPSDQIEEQISTILVKVGLMESSDVTSLDLSGGQKRLLSFAISLLSNPKILILDEPTSGM